MLATGAIQVPSLQDRVRRAPQLTVSIGASLRCAPWVELARQKTRLRWPLWTLSQRIGGVITSREPEEETEGMRQTQDLELNLSAALCVLRRLGRDNIRPDSSSAPVAWGRPPLLGSSQPWTVSLRRVTFQGILLGGLMLHQGDHSELSFMPRLACFFLLQASIRAQET